MIHENLSENILLAPVASGCDCLKIVTGYATHTMASWHMQEISERFPRQNVDICLVVGMCNYDGLSVAVHTGFKRLIQRSWSSYVRLHVGYVYCGAPVHSKLYLWERARLPFSAFMGSANYTQSAFSRTRREIMTICDALDALNYFDWISSCSVDCNVPDVERYVKFRADFTSRTNFSNASLPSVSLSFITRSGETGRRQHFSVTTNDGVQLVLRIEQQNDKAITTPENNSLLGKYFRRRLSVAEGAYVTAEDFMRYGRDSVTFYKLSEYEFFMDFSVR